MTLHVLIATALAAAAVLAATASPEASAPAGPASPASGAMPPGHVTFFAYNSGTLMRTRLDPIIDPSDISGHVHVFAGANRITADMDHASAISSKCTTAPLSVDKSGYWAPQLYYKSRAGKYHALSHFGIITYWLYRGFEEDEEPPELPADFRMVGGSPMRTTYDPAEPAHKAISFQCFGPGYDFNLPYIPADFECETIRPQVEFPNCWNGKDEYKPDQSHVAYGIGDHRLGKCPPGFVRIPTLLLEIAYNPKLALGDAYEWYPGCLVFAHGDIQGHTFHADWLNGFPPNLLVDAFKQCKSMNGDIAQCPMLAQHAQDGVQCTVEGHIINEAVGIDAPLDALPGDNKEFNCSLASKPKSPGYTETAQIVEYVEANGGGCSGNVCTDYKSGGRAVILEGPAGDTGGLSTGTDTGGATATGADTATDGPAATSLVVTAGDRVGGTTAVVSDGEGIESSTAVLDAGDPQTTTAAIPDTNPPTTDTDQPVLDPTPTGAPRVSLPTDQTTAVAPPITDTTAVIPTSAPPVVNNDPAPAQRTYGVPKGMTGGRFLTWPEAGAGTGVPRRRTNSGGGGGGVDEL